MINPTVPKNIDAEIALLGCIFLDESVMLEVLDQISYSDFYDGKNKEIFKAMEEIYQSKKSIDLTTVCSYLKENNKLGVAGNIDYINQIFNSSYTTQNIETYINLIKDASLRRRYINTLNALVQKGYDASVNINDYSNDIEHQIFELSKSKRTGELEPVYDVIQKVKDNVIKNSLSRGEITGLNTGFDSLNRITLGLQKDALIILAARPAMGKSAFAMNLAVQVAELNKDSKASVAVFSLEMSSDQLVERMISSEALIDSKLIKKGAIFGEDGIRFSNASDKLSKLNIYFDDSSSISVEDIRTKCRKLAAEKGLDLVVIDYLQLINGDSTKSKHEEVSMISRSLKLMARELHVPVVALAQLSRDVEKRDEKKPIMADLRDSGSIEQDADIVMFLYREDYYKPKTSTRPGEADLIISKNRSGTAGVELPFQFQGQFSKFIEIERKEEQNA